MMKYLTAIALGLLVAVVAVSPAVAKKKATIHGLNNPQSSLFTYQGEAFAAVLVPTNMQAKIGTLQGQLGTCLGAGGFSASPASNLHITLQLIGKANTASSVKRIHQALVKSANNNQPWNLGKHTPNVRISVHGSVVMLTLPRSDTLTKLARSVRNQLDRAKIKHSSRFDFPDHGHITIGATSNPAAAAAVKACQANGTVNLGVVRSKSFKVDGFSLLKSNRPATPRRYGRVASYSLK